MVNKSLKLISCAAVLVAGATAFVSIAGAKFAGTGFFQQNVRYIKASALNTLDWDGEYFKEAVDAKTLAGTVSVGENGITFETSKADGVDWHVKLANYSVAVTQYDTYELTFVLDSSVASADGKGAIINVDGGKGCWERRSISAGANTIKANFFARDNSVPIELQLGEFVTDSSTVSVKSVNIKKVNNLVSSYDASVISGNKCTSAVVGSKDSVHVSTYNFDNTAGDKTEDFGCWNNKLQATTSITINGGTQYELFYEVESNVALSGCEILHGRHDPSSDAYFEKWEDKNQDGKYGVTLNKDAIHRFSTYVTPGFDFKHPVISIRPGEEKAGTIKLTGLRITAMNNYYGDTVYSCNLESAESWVQRWQAARGATGGLCANGNKTLVLELIEAYDNLVPSERDKIKDTKDVTYEATDYTYAQSVEYFRAHFAD